MQIRIDPCPYCRENMPEPRKLGGTVFETCPACHKTARAKFIRHDDRLQVVYLPVRKVARVTRPVRVLAELADLLASNYELQEKCLQYLTGQTSRNL